MPDVSRGDQIAQTAEAIGRSFAVELGRVLRDAERALRPVLRRALEGNRTARAVAVRGVGLRRQLRLALTDAGYDALAEASTTAAVERMSEAVLASRLAARGLQPPNPAKLRALAELGRANLLQVGDDVAAALWRSLAQWLFTVRDADAILGDLMDVFEDEIGNLQTLFDTQVSIFGRQVEAIATAGADADQPFWYVGPVDLKTRAWCLERVGKVYTRDVIEAMDNHQLPNPFITGGGYSCRHSFLAVQGQEFHDLANTGRRADSFEDRVNWVVAQRAAMRRRRAA